jgi:hypothetical protein
MPECRRRDHTTVDPVQLAIVTTRIFLSGIMVAFTRLKYVVLSRPAPAEMPHSIAREGIIQEAFRDGSFPSLAVRMAYLDEQERQESEPVSSPKTPY